MEEFDAKQNKTKQKCQMVNSRMAADVNSFFLLGIKSHLSNLENICQIISIYIL